jgi:hypothetical protein
MEVHVLCPSDFSTDLKPEFGKRRAREEADFFQRVPVLCVLRFNPGEGTKNWFGSPESRRKLGPLP